MFRKLLALFGLAGLLALSATPAFANHIDTATVKPSCNGYSISLSASALNPGLNYKITWSISGYPTAQTGSVSFKAPSSGTFSDTISETVSPAATGTLTFSGTATLVGDNTISISFSPSSITCPTPPPPPKCKANTSNGSNFNGTPINSGNFIWFNANFTANGVPTTGTEVIFTNSTININGQNLPVPNAQITFSPNNTCLSTTFDSGANTFVTTAPTNGSDEIFLTALSFPVPANLGTVSGNVTWNGTFATNTPGVTMNWKWGAAVYTSPCFTTNYNAIAPLAGHGNACVGNSGGDHAGTPEGTSPTTGQSLKACVIGGARGGGGSNWTGSWSGTNSVTPVCQ